MRDPLNPQQRVDDYYLGSTPAMLRLRGLPSGYTGALCIGTADITRPRRPTVRERDLETMDLPDLPPERLAELNELAGVFSALHPQAELIDIDPQPQPDPDEDERDDHTVDDSWRQRIAPWASPNRVGA